MPDEVVVADDASLEAADAASTKSLAAKMAAAVAQGLQTDKPAQTPAEQAAATTEDTSGQSTEPAAETVEAPAAEEPTAEAKALTEVERVLQEAGIDIGITAADVPEELHPAYERMLQSVIDFAERGMAEHLEATKAMRQVEEFKQRLESAPDRILLALAVSRPDIFQKAVETFNAIQTDEGQKALVIRELETEAKYQDAIRRENLMGERERRIKANQVIAATKRSSRQHGIEYTLAEKVVALAVQANNGDLDVSDVDGIVSELKPAVKKPITVKPKVQSPAKQDAVAKTPAQQTPTTSTPSPGLEDKTNNRVKGGGKFRQLIGDAMTRLGGGQQ